MGAGQDPFVFAHEHRDEVAWLSQNTNHLSRHPGVKEAMIASIEAHEGELYPFPAGVFGLPELVREDLGLDEAWQVRLTHGALEAIYCFMRAALSPGDEVIATDPSFQPLHHHARLCGAVVVEVPIYQGNHKLTLEAAEAARTDKTRVLLLIDPHNPLGIEYTRDEVEAFARWCREHDILLLHDITYRDFAYDATLAGAFYPEGTAYAVSYSKSCGLAGLRIGALVAQADLMDRVRPHFVNGLGTNVLAQRAVAASLKTKAEWLPETLRTSRANQAMIKACVDGIDGLSLPVYPSSSNTLCIDVSARGIDPDQIERKLLYEHKVFVRSGKYLSKPVGARFIRVSFTVSPTDCQRFCDAFPKVIESL